MERTVSISVGLLPEGVAQPHLDGVGRPATLSAAARRAPTPLGSEHGTLRPGTLRFRDADLERRYQRKAGAESLAGFRITTSTAAVLWLFAALVLPTATSI